MADKKYLDYEGLKQVATEIKKVDTVANNAMNSASCANTRLNNLNGTQVSYNNTTSGMTAINVQGAVDELYSDIRQISHGIVPKGTVEFENLPSLERSDVGDMYNISNDFTTTEDFITPGINEKAGSNVYVAELENNEKKWDVFAVAPDVVVDQSYNPLSHNPQSGTAVAQIADTKVDVSELPLVTQVNTSIRNDYATDHSHTIYNTKLYIAANGLYVTENGLDFTNVPVSDVYGNITVVGSFNGKLFRGCSEGEVGVSNDGINFEKVSYFGEYDYTRGFVEFNGKLFVIQDYVVSYTADGENFSGVQGLGFCSDLSAGIVFNNKLYIAGRNSADDEYYKIVFWVSSDGLNFTKVDIDPTYLRQDYNVYCHGMTVFNNKLYVVLEYSEDDSYKVFSSSDGVTFTEESGFPTDKRILTLTVIDDVFYVGTEGQGIFTSTDAVSFTLNTNFPTNVFVEFITKYNGVFEVQGNSNEGLYQISTKGSLRALKPSFVQSTTVPTQNSDTFMSSGSIYNALSCKVDKVSGKGLSTCDFTSALRTKLTNIQCGAEVNVQSDWNQSDDTKDDFIKNKPNLASVATSGDYDDLTNKPVINGVEVEGGSSGNKYGLADLDKLPYGSSDTTVLDFSQEYGKYLSFAKKVQNKVFFSFDCSNPKSPYAFSCVSSDGGVTYEHVCYESDTVTKTSYLRVLDVAYCEEVAYGNNYWNAIIKREGSSSTELCTSSDGITFTPVSSGYPKYSCCTSYHGMLLYGSASGSGLTIKYQSQGSLRTRLSGEHVDVLTVIDDTIYIITGNKNIYTSTDADNFIQIATVSFTANNMVKLGSTYYFQTATVAQVTNIPKLTTSGIYTTTDFVTFTNLSEVDEGALGLIAVFDDKLFVTIGHGLYSTTDCVTFTPCDLGDEFFYPEPGYYSDFCAITAIASIDDTLWVGNYKLTGNSSSKIIKLKNLNNSLKYLRPSMVQSTSAVTKGSDTFISSNVMYNALSCKVDKVAGKGLSSYDFSYCYMNKLNGIQCGAEVNVQPDWNQSDSTQDDFVKNKPSINGKILISDGTGRSYSLVDREELPSNTTLDSTQFTSWHFQNVFAFKNKLCAIYNSNHLAVFSDGEWSNPTIPSEINSLYCPTVFNNHLCFGTEDGLYVTEDLVTFTLVESVTTSISKLTVFNNKLYLTGYNTPIYVTEDLTTFTTLDFTASGINDMTGTSTSLYVAVRSDFVYVSTDGATFTHLTKPEGLPTNNVALMEPDEDASVMYIGTLSYGLYISNLELSTVQSTEIGAPYAVQCVSKYKGQVFVGTENGIYVQDTDDVFKLFDSSDTVSLQEYDDELYAATYEDGLKSFKTEHELQYLKPSDVQSTSVPTQGSDTFISSNGVYVALSSLSSSVDTKLAAKVDKVEGKGLSTNDFTNDYKNKLDGIESGAEVNVQSDWNAVSGDAYIDNKPQINSVALTGNNNGKHYGLVDEADLQYIKPSDVAHTTVPTEDSDTFISSGDVKTAIDSALSSVYKAKGSKTVEEMIPSLLVESNLGYVYNMSNSGVTTQYFVEGAGHAIRIGDNVVIIKDTDNTIKFDLLSGLVDLSNYVQKSNTTGLLKNDGSVDTNAYTTCTGTVTLVSINSQVGIVCGGTACVQCVCAYLCQMTLSDTQVALVGSANGGPFNNSGYYALFSDTVNALKYNPQCQKLTVGSRFCVCDSSVGGRSDFSFSGSLVAFFTPTCSGSGICMDMYNAKVTAKCFDGNATCFGGFTFSSACSCIRSGLTSCTGTVTISNSTCGSAIPIALCTGSTTVGRSTCCSLTYVPTSGTLKVNGTDISHNSICAYNTNFTLSTAGTAGSLTIIPNYGVCLVPIIPTSTPTCLCNGMIWIS